MSSFNYNLLTDFLKIVLEQITLKGIDNIDGSDLVHERKLNFNEETGDISIDKEYVVYTDGINIEKLKYIKGINHNLTTCNDIMTIFKLYGIEAARSGLVKEVDGTFTNGGSTINFHHVSIVCDLMTHSGSITSIDRFGLNRLDTDPLARASFEKTIEVLINAAVFNETDYMRSVSSRIMAGKIFRGGTGLCDVILDNEILENSEFDEYKGNKNNNNFMELTKFNLIDDILNKNEIDDIYIPK
jgi:DNA-directed RNA polymerase II subunit RPB1